MKNIKNILYIDNIPIRATVPIGSPPSVNIEITKSFMVAYRTPNSSEFTQNGVQGYNPCGNENLIFGH